MFCPACGFKLQAEDKFCLKCGTKIGCHDQLANIQKEACLVNRTHAALFAFFLGYIGIHDFILGRTTQGVIKIILWITGCFLVIPLIASAVWVTMDLHAIANDTYPSKRKKLAGSSNTANVFFIINVVFLVLGTILALFGILGLIFLS